MRLLIKNIKNLVQIDAPKRVVVKGKDMSILPQLTDAWLAIEDGLIADFGKMDDFPGIEDWSNLQIIDAQDRFVFPSWCDSHTHLIYAHSREEEFASRLRGESYASIAAKGGGILNSAKKLQNTSEDELVAAALGRLNTIIQQGTGAVEIKSGYGLSMAGELKMLKVIQRLKALSPLTIQATFLGAHAIPEEFKNNKAGYIQLLTEELIPAIGQEKLADYCDVFCEENYFTKAETIHILEVGLKHGLKPRVHAEQMSHSGGIEAGVQCGAISVDHLEYISDNDIDLLLASNTMPTLLPGAQLFLQLQTPPARKMMDKGLPIAIASDFNPGSCPSGNMNLMVSLSCIVNKMTPEEAINAATINSAYAMNLSQTHGSIGIGKKANLFITQPIPSIAFLPYNFGETLIETVILNGEIQTFN